MLEVKSGNSGLDESISNWLRWDHPSSKSYNKVQELIAAANWQELEKIMMTRLAFGTAGIRGRMGPG